MWNRIKSAKWFIPVIVAVIVGVLATVGVVAAASGWFSTTVPSTGTINITTTTTTTPPPPAADYNYTLSGGINFGATTFEAGAAVSVTGTVTVTNTGNQTIGHLDVAGQHLPSWITSVTITQTPVAVGASVQETITLSGTAPSVAQLFNLVGPDVMHTGGITITPRS